MESPKRIHKVELAGYSSVVGQPIMLLDERGACIGQLALIGAQHDYKEMVAEVAAILNAPNRHAYQVGVVVGKASKNTRADLIDKDVLRQVEAILVKTTATATAIAALTKDPTIKAECTTMGQENLHAITALRAMLEKLE